MHTRTCTKPKHKQQTNKPHLLIKYMYAKRIEVATSEIKHFFRVKQQYQISCLSRIKYRRWACMCVEIQSLY